MSGGKSGVQARIKEKQPKARYTHCFAHSLNLAIQKVCREVRFVQNALSVVQGGCRGMLALQDPNFERTSYGAGWSERISLDNAARTPSLLGWCETLSLTLQGESLTLTGALEAAPRVGEVLKLQDRVR